MVKVIVNKRGRIQIDGKIYMKQDGEFELPDPVAGPLIKNGILLPVVQPLVPSANDEEVSALKQKIVDLESLVNEKDSLIVELTSKQTDANAGGRKK